MPNYALDNADIVREAIYREPSEEGLSSRPRAGRLCQAFKTATT